ncbi:MAG: type II secretion system F family protein [Candidatus Doudnabacteria bacterium]|nr:type II secretion system F family protein [Candidatus Doudnabacteria bacterium]
MEFAYQARDKQGVLKAGTVEAASESSAFEILGQHGLTVIKVFPNTQLNLFGNITFLERISLKDIVLFSRQLATLINAKVPIVQALRIMRLQVSSKKFQKIIDEITEKVESGNSLSSALSAYPDVFNSLYISLVKSGELSGSLDEALVYLANQLEKDYDLRSKVIGALIYPIFIVLTLLVVGILMFIYVLPPLVSILQESAVELPFTTRILIGATNLVQHYLWLLIAGLVGLVVGFRFYARSVSGRHLIDYAKINAPIFGRLSKNIYMSRFARNLATLVAGGIPIVKALEAVADIVGNQIYKDLILDAAKEVRNGKTIASALSSHREVPAVLIQMTQIGESTGKLREIMDKLASFYEKEVEGLLSALTTLIEPLIMILLGLAVAVMVAGILLPIYNLAGTA